MARILMFICAMSAFVMASAETFTYRFNSTPLPKAIQRIMENHPNLDINFIYNELENYKTSATVKADNPYDALRQTIGLNPVAVVKAKNTYYVEALQHGKFIYTGRAIGTDNEPVVAATAMLLAPKDSTVLTYGIADENGRFRIPCDRTNVIAKISCIGYKTTYINCKSFALGTIVMPERAVKLGTVTVKGDNSQLYADKSIYIPTRRQKNAAQNAIDLLRQMSIPQITINIMDNDITTLTGQDVALFINYLPASSEEVEGLLTGNIRRVEYIDFPTDPRFNGAEHVVNFIMPKYEFGGYTKFTGTENFLAGFSNRESIYSKFSYKKMSYDMYVGTSNHNLHHVGTSYNSTYDVNNNSLTEKIHRQEISDNAHFKYNEIPVTFRSVYDSDKIQIANTLGFVFDQSPLAETYGDVSYTPQIFNNISYLRTEPYTTRHYTWSGNYYFILPYNFHLSINPATSYSHTNYTYSYQSEIEHIENRSKENAYYIKGSVNLYKILSQNQNIFMRGFGGTNHNNVSYYGSSPYDNKFSDSFAGVTLGYNFSNKKWNFNVDAAIQWEQNKINDMSVKEIYPLINLSATFSPSRMHSIRAFFHFGANYPGASDKTPNILKQNELLYITGNPDLGLSRQVTFNLQYNWVPNNNIAASIFAQYFGEYNLFVPIYSCVDEGCALLKSFVADGDYNRMKTGISFNYKLLDGNLQFAAQPSVSFYKMTGLYSITYTPFYFNASATYYLGNFYFQASYQTPSKTVQGNRASYYSDRDYYQILAGWSCSGWNIRLSAINLLRNDWHAATQTFVSPLYTEIKSIGGNNYHRRLNLSVTYTFNYGKKLRQENEVGQQSGTNSAILK